ncbi:MAG: oligoendopeptidase, partial [Alphaproteobacteria bacterium]|nr:oligoendopeptidase [Alphaproteobacteria bacterium]
MPRPTKTSIKRATRPRARSDLRRLPEWNLADLYPAIDAPEVKRDLDQIDTECLSFEEAYKGRLAEIAQGPDAGRILAEAVKR